MHSNNMPTTTLAGITVPDTPLIKAAIYHARAHSSDMTYNHIMRSWLFSTLAVQRAAPPDSIDIEVQSLAALLHDLGWDCTGEFVSTDKRFEVDGAIAARAFIDAEQEKGIACDWDEHRKQLVWDAIALHTTPSIAQYKQPVVGLVGAGIASDFRGPDSDPTGSVTWKEYHAVVKAFPRLDLAKGVREIICGFVDKKPGTTYDTWMQPYGVKYRAQTYTVEGKLGIDLVDGALE